MKKIIHLLFVSILSFQTVIAQTTTYSYSGNNYVCSNYSSGSGIGLISSQPSSGIFNFRIIKREGSTCSNGPNGTFLNNVTWTLYQTGVGSVGTGSTLGSGSSSGTSTLIQLTMPSSFTSGTRSYYAVMVSGGITFTTGNIAIVATTTVQLPDLTVSNVTLSSQSVPKGNNVTVYHNLQNNGPAISSSFELKYYLSTNTTYGAGDIELNYGTTFTNGIIDNYNSNESKLVNIPTTVAAGAYYIIPYVDANSQISEANETNNTSFIFLNITNPPQPDLQISSVSLSSQNVLIGGNVTATYSFANSGGASTGFDVRFFLSSNSSYDASDVLLDSYSVTSLPGSYSNNSLTRSLTIPTNTTAGSYYILAIADLTNQVSESNENNNWSFVYLNINAAPTITVTSPISGGTYYNLNTLPISWTTTGSVGSNISIELVNTANATIAVIVDPTTNSGSYSWAIPNSISAGSYKIKIYNTGSGSVVGYSGIFSVGTNPNCPSCITGQTLSNFTLTGQEGFCAAQYLCNKGIIQVAQSNPTNVILRQDLAKIVLLGLLNDNANPSTFTLPSDNFPSPFNDLLSNGDANSFHRYAKALSYLSYPNDTLTPFNRNRPSFNPAGTIVRIDMIKVLIEAWNEPLDANGTVLQFTDIGSLTSQQISYLKKGVAIGIITNQTSFRPYDNCTREEAFLFLSRIRQLRGNKNAAVLDINNYYVPFKQNIETLSMLRSFAEGNFSNFGEGGFEIPDIGFSLGFDFNYQSSLTELPDVWRNISPLGVGWTHRYNSYMFTTAFSPDESGGVVGKPLLIVAWGNGTYDTYDNTNVNNPIKIGLGNYNTLTYVSSTQYTIKTKNQVTYTFTQQGTDVGLYRLSAITDRYGNTLSLVYKTGTTVPFSSYKMVLDYVQVPSGRRASFLYDSQNQISEIQFPASSSGQVRKLTFTYDSRRLKTFKDAKGQSTGKVTTYDYGTDIKMFLLKTVTYPKGNKIETDYNGNFKATYITKKNSSGNTMGTIIINPVAQYNSNGTYNTSTISPEGITTNYSFDKNGIATSIQSNAISISRPTNNTTHPTLPSSLTQNGKTAIPSYDAKGNVTSIQRPDNKTEYFTYDAYNNLTAHTDAKGITTTYGWSSDGKFLNSVSRPIGNGSNLTQTFSYMTNGMVSSVTNNEGVVTNYAYNSYGNLNQVSLPVLSLTSSAIYDYASRMASATNARGKTTSYQYDLNDNLIQETDPLNRNTNYGYDDNDNLTTITNAKGGVTTLTYDSWDRLISEEFGGSTKAYDYDIMGRLTQHRKAGYATDNSRKFDYIYDPLTGFLKSNGYIQDIGYDATTKNMNSIRGGTNASNSLSNFIYDNLNRLSSYTDYYGFTVGYGYDDNGNVTRIDYPNNNKLYKTYDNLNRLRTLTWNTTLIATYNYVGSQLDNIVYGNGVKAQMTYDNAGRPTSQSTKTNNGTGSTIYAVNFTLDNLGNHTEENETHPFSTIPTPTAGTTNYTYTTTNRIQTAGSSNFTHDGDGNVKTKSLSAGSNNYGYDLEDNLTSISGTTTNSYEYDAFGNRRKAIRNGTETHYVLDINGLATILAETNSSNTVQNYYIHGLGLAARIKPDGTIHYYHPDFRGSTIGMTDASQSITHKYQYDEFGNLLNSQEADPNPFRYVGTYGIMYETPDLAYMRARYYDPTTGRFNSEDPIWGTNLYPYADNNGVMNVDIDGEYWESAKYYLNLFFNNNNWLRIGTGWDANLGRKVFRIAWGAHQARHLKDVPKYLQGLNQLLRSVGGGHLNITYGLVIRGGITTVVVWALLFNSEAGEYEYHWIDQYKYSTSTGEIIK